MADTLPGAGAVAPALWDFLAVRANPRLQWRARHGIAAAPLCAFCAKQPGTAHRVPKLPRPVLIIKKGRTSVQAAVSSLDRYPAVNKNTQSYLSRSKLNSAVFMPGTSTAMETAAGRGIGFFPTSITINF